MKLSLIAVLALSGVLTAGYVPATQKGRDTGSRSSQSGGTQAAPSQSAQNPRDDDADANIAILRKDIRGQKRNIIATKVPLTDAEAEKFWPVYDQYTAELVRINNDKYTLIKDYTQNYDTMTDAQAGDWARRTLKLDLDVAALRQKYWANFSKVLPAKKAALYEQVERRTQMVIDAQLASQFPLVQAK